MSYTVVLRQFDLDDRPLPIVTDPATMTHPVAMLHHRISWNVIGGALNGVLAGTVDPGIVGTLLSMSPGRGGSVTVNFTTAVTRVRAGQTLSGAQVAALELVEQLLCWLPSNVFQGLNARADDPGAGIDFLPGDVNPDGTLPRAGGALTQLGQLQQARERLCNRLMHPPAPGARSDIATICQSVVQLWAAQTPPAPAIGGVPPRPSLAQATGFNAAQWAPGAPPFTAPPFRNFAGPLSAAQCLALNATVMNRVNTAT